jgi:hypothetical protein
MKQIRKGIFETNSSSTHCITIKKKFDEISLPKKLAFKGDEYGWEHRILDTPEEKASYLYSSIVSFYEGNELKFSDYKNYIYDTLAKNDIECEFYPVNADSYWWDCYVDHCEGLARFLEYVRASEKHLMYYLFGDGIVITGNDNDNSYADVVSEYKEHVDKSDWTAFEKWN